MDPYREYLELFDYFGRGGVARLTREQFEALDAEWSMFAKRVKVLTQDEKSRFEELKAVLFRDRP